MQAYAYLLMDSNNPMKTESFIYVFAGCMILLSLMLVQYFGRGWLILTGLIGLNLIQSAFTGFCPPTLILRRLGWIDSNGIIRWGGHHPKNHDKE